MFSRKSSARQSRSRKPRLDNSDESQRKQVAKATHSVNGIQNLQGTIGNHAVNRLISRTQPQRTSQREIGLVVRDIHNLQGSIGNQAINRLVSRAQSGRTIQRETGLAVEETTREFAGSARQIYTKAAAGQMPIADYIRALYANVSLPLILKGNCFPPTWDLKGSAGDLGSFMAKDWAIHLTPNAFTNEKRKLPIVSANQLTVDEAAEITDTLYHESRHAEQYFRMARMMAGRGSTAEEIAKNLQMRKDAAAAAAEVPLTEGAKAEDKGLFDEARDWEAILVTYRSYKEKVGPARNHLLTMFNVVNTKGKALQMGQLKTQWTGYYKDYISVFEKTKSDIEGVDKKIPAETDILKHVSAILLNYKNLEQAFNEIQAADQSTSPFKKEGLMASATKKFLGLCMDGNKICYQAYLAFSHEVDAHAVGGKAKAAFLAG